MNSNSQSNNADGIPDLNLVPEVLPVARKENSPPLVFVDPPSPGIWGALGWCLLFFLVLAISSLVVAGMDLLIEKQGFGELIRFLKEEQNRIDSGSTLSPETRGAIGRGFLVAEINSILFALLVIRMKIGREWIRKIAFRIPQISHLLLGLIALPALMVLHGAAHQLANWIFQIDPHNSEKGMETLDMIFREWPRWLGILVIGIGPGLGEELWCRGYLGRGLIGRYGYVWGVICTSIFFGLLHVSIPYAMGTALMGACLHFTYLMTRSLLIPILLHTLNNSFSLLIQVGDIPLGQANPDELVSIPLLIAAGLLTTAVGFAFYQTRGRLVNEKGKEVHPPIPSVAIPSSGSGVTVIHQGLTPGSIVFVLIGAVVFGSAFYYVE